MEEILGKNASELSPGELRLLEGEFESWSRKTEAMRERLREHQAFHENVHRGKLREELGDLDKRVEEEHRERVALEDKLRELRAREASVAVESDKLQEALDAKALEHQLEQVAVLRIKAERLREKRLRMEKAEGSRRAQIEAIHEEVARRSESGERTLARLLKKVDVLRQELDQPEYEDEGFQRQVAAGFAAEDADDVAGGVPASLGEGCATLADRVGSVRESRWEAKVRELEAELGTLCEARAKVAEEERAIKERRRDYDKLMSKGLDYLVEMELGNAPPVDYILRNMAMRCEEGEEELDQPAQGEDGGAGAGAGGRRRGSDDDDDGDDDDEGGDEDAPMDELIERVERGMNSSKKTIEEMQRGLKEMEQERERVRNVTFLSAEERVPYDGSLGRASYSSEQQPTYDAMRAILVDFVDSILNGTAMDRAQARIDAETALARWKATRTTLEAELEATATEAAIRGVAAEMSERILVGILRGIHGELETADTLAGKVSDNIVMGAVFTLQGTDEGGLSKEAAVMVKNSLAEMQKQRQQWFGTLRGTCRIPPRHMTLRLTKPLLPQDVSVFYSTNAAYSIESISRIREQLERLRAAEGEQEERRSEERMNLMSVAELSQQQGTEQAEEDEDSDEEEFIKLDYSLVPAMSLEDIQGHAPGFDEREKTFWNKVSFRSKHIKIPQRPYGTASALACSAGGDFLAVGTGLGALLVYDLRPDKHAVLVRTYVDKQAKGVTRQVSWSQDLGTRIATLDDEGVVRVFSTLRPARPRKTRRVKEKFKHAFHKGHFRPEPLELLLTLTWKDFDRPVQRDAYDGEEQASAPEEVDKTKGRKRRRRGKKGPRPASQAELHPCFVRFHTAHTVMGQQTSLLVGLANGVIVKWNLNAKQGDRSVFCPIYADSEPANPRDPSFVPGKPRPKGELFGSTITREFLQDHMHAVQFMGFVGHSTEMLYTLDEKDHLNLWPYVPSQYSGFGWYLPLHRFKLDLIAVSFEADTTKPVEEVFPPDGVEIPKPAAPGVGKRKPTEDEAIDADPDFLELQEEELKIVEGLELSEIPWLRRTMKRNERYMEIYAPSEAEEEGNEGASTSHQVLIFSKGGRLLKRMVSSFTSAFAHGRLLQAEMSHSGAEILFLVQFPATAEKTAYVRIFMYDCHTLEVVRASVELAIPGHVEPRFAVSPVFAALGSDYCYVLMADEVYVLSLTSGLRVCRRLSPLKNEPGVALTDLVVSRDHDHLACLGTNSDTVYLFAIDDSNDPADSAPPEEGAYRPRAAHVPPECLA